MSVADYLFFLLFRLFRYSLKKMLNLEHSPNQDYSSVYDDCKTEGSSSPYNNMSYEYDEMNEPRVEVKEMAGNYSNDEGGVDDELLYPDVEILSNGKHEPLHRVAKRVKRSAEAAAAAAAKEADSSAQLKLNQHHMNHYYHIQQQQHSHAKVHPVDLFFYSMAETTKGLPQAYQAEIKRRVLEIVIKAEEEMNKNKNYEWVSSRTINTSPSLALSSPLSHNEQAFFVFVPFQLFYCIHFIYIYIGINIFDVPQIRNFLVELLIVYGSHIYFIIKSLNLLLLCIWLLFCLV